MAIPVTGALASAFPTGAQAVSSQEGASFFNAHENDSTSSLIGLLGDSNLSAEDKNIVLGLLRDKTGGIKDGKPSQGSQGSQGCQGSQGSGNDDFDSLLAKLFSGNLDEEGKQKLKKLLMQHGMSAQQADNFIASGGTSTDSSASTGNGI